VDAPYLTENYDDGGEDFVIWAWFV